MNDLDTCHIKSMLISDHFTRKCGPTTVFMDHPRHGPIAWCDTHAGSWAIVGKPIASKEDAIIMSLMQT